MKGLIRALFALISTIAFAASVYVYLYSFKGMTMEGVGGWPFDLHIEIFLVMVPIFVVESPGYAINKRYINLTKARPNWIGPMIQVLFTVFAINFLFFLVLSHGAAPAIIDEIMC